MIAPMNGKKYTPATNKWYVALAFSGDMTSRMPKWFNSLSVIYVTKIVFMP